MLAVNLHKQKSLPLASPNVVLPTAMRLLKAIIVASNVVLRVPILCAQHGVNVAICSPSCPASEGEFYGHLSSYQKPKPYVSYQTTNQ